MIPVHRPRSSGVLSRDCRDDLARRQARVTGLARRDPAIKAAWDGFHRSKARRELVAVLRTLFHEKCAYCENIIARDVEHFYPKSLYPKRMFKWANLLWACKNCNTDKLASFPLRRGKPVLLDPCREGEDPADFFTWQQDTGMPVVSADPERALRAEETIVTFDLRNQELCEQRRMLARYFRFFLAAALDDDPKPDVERCLLDMTNPRRPWRSVLRQIVRDPRNARLIKRVRAKLPALRPAFDELST